MKNEGVGQPEKADVRKMTEKPQFPDLKVAVVLVVHGGRILVVFNDKWGAYALPMTKRRVWNDPNAAGGKRVEEWIDAAIRARTECVPGTSTIAPVFQLCIPEYQQSDRDGEWKRYEFHVFKTALANPYAVGPGGRTEWLTPAELLNPQRCPISKTARDIVRQAQAEANLRGQPFP